MDLAKLYEQAVGQQQARMRGADNEISNVNNLTLEMANIMQSSANASRAVGEATASEVEAKGVRELAADAERKRMEAAMMSPHNAQDLVDFMGQTSARIAAQKAQLDQERAGLVSKMETSFADDPLGWMVNAFTVPEEIRTYNAKYEGLKGEMEFQAKVDSALRSGLSTQKQLEATTSAQEVHAAATKARNMATVVALNSQYKAMESSLTAVQLRTSLMNVKADAAKDALNMSLSMAANARAEEAAEDARVARKEKKLAEDELSRYLPAAFAAHGLSAEQGTLASWKKLMQVDKDAAESILKFAYKLDYAKDSSRPDAIAGVRITEEPVDAWTLVKGGLPLQGNGAQAAWLKSIDAQTQSFLRTQRYEGTKDFLALPKAQQAEIYRKTFNEIAKKEAQPSAANMKVSASQLGGLRVGGDSLLNLAPNVAKLLAANPKLSQKEYAPEELFALVRADIATSMIATGGAGLNARAALIQKYGKELASVYDAKAQHLFLTVQPHLVGVPTDPKAKYEYTYSVPGFIFDKKVKANLRSPEEVMRVLLKESINE